MTSSRTQLNHIKFLYMISNQSRSSMCLREINLSPNPLFGLSSKHRYQLGSNYIAIYLEVLELDLNCMKLPLDFGAIEWSIRVMAPEKSHRILVLTVSQYMFFLVT